MGAFRTLDDAGDLKGRRVLLRVDLNVPVKDGAVTDATRIERVAPTIRELSDRGAKLALLAHFERPKGRRVPAMSLAPIAAAVAAAIDRPVGFVEDCVGADAEARVSPRSATAAWCCWRTPASMPARRPTTPTSPPPWRALGDVYVNDAFSAAHRAHASTEGLAHVCCPPIAGRAMQKELEALEKALTDPRKPVLAVVGGAKVSTKIELLANLLGKVDALVIGGGMANTFLAAKGVEIGKSLNEPVPRRHRAPHHAAGRRCRRCHRAAGRRGRGRNPSPPTPRTRRCRSTACRPRSMILDAGEKTVEVDQRLDRQSQDAGVERPARRLRAGNPSTAPPWPARAMRRREALQGKLLSVAGGGDTVAALNHAGAAGRLHLCLDRRRRLPGMAGRQAVAGGRCAARREARISPGKTAQCAGRKWRRR